jgi:hypothetical protein
MFAKSARFIMQHGPFFIHNRVLIRVSLFVDNLRLPYPGDHRISEKQGAQS